MISFFFVFVLLYFHSYLTRNKYKTKQKKNSILKDYYLYDLMWFVLCCYLNKTLFTYKLCYMQNSSLFFFFLLLFENVYVVYVCMERSMYKLCEQEKFENESRG